MSARPVCHACAIVSSADRPQVIDRRQTARGELVLRRAGGHFEVIADGTFLMDTRDGRSERELVRAAAADGRDLRLLIGGLGVGFSLDEALAGTGVSEVVVVEIEPAVVEWARTHLRGLTAHGLDDPRVRLVVDELYRHLLADPARYDGICLDVDNGPGWLVHPANAALYDEPGLALLCGAAAAGRAAGGVGGRRGRRTSSGGCGRGSTASRCVRVPVPRGPDDVIYVGLRPAQEPG